MKHYYLVCFNLFSNIAFSILVIYEIFDTNFHVAPEERPNFTKEKLKQILCEQIITEKAFGNQATEVIEEILEFYLPENEE